MGRLQVIAIVALPLLVPIGTTCALEASDTLAAWKRASAVEKGVIVDKMLKGRGTARVIECLDAASDAPGHAELAIRQMIKACDKASNEPV